MSLKSQFIVRASEAGLTAASAAAPFIMSLFGVESEVVTPDMLANTTSILGGILASDIATASWRERYTHEVREISNLYKMVLDHAVNFFGALKVRDPLLAFYVFYYMYNHGSLSFERNFFYGTEDSIDLAGFQGVDVIRGCGVCRSISSLLNDIYQEMGYNSFTMGGKLCGTDFKEGHMINIVDVNGKCAYLDPTNGDTFIKENGTLLTPNGEEKFNPDKFAWLYTNLLGVYNNGINIVKLNRLMKETEVTREMYDEAYNRAQALIDKNPDGFVSFYFEMEDVYEKIWESTQKVNVLTRHLNPMMMKGHKNKKDE